VDEPEADSSWLFMEDAGGDEFSYSIEEHRRRAACWLGQMHLYASSARSISRLPDRGPKHYLEHLRFTRTMIQRHLHDKVLKSSPDLRVIEAILSQGYFLESKWDRVEEFCGGFPGTLVHCDFAAYNLRLRKSAIGANLLAFDWEMAGFGTPAPDIAELSGRGVPRRRPTGDLSDLELTEYWSEVEEGWRGVDFSALKELAELGAVFRSLAAISWESESIGRGWWPIRELYGYHLDLEIAINHLRFL
jgi:hypothetical protein